MVTARQKRDIQRKGLLDGLMQKLWEYVDVFHPGILFVSEVAVLVLRYLSLRQAGKLPEEKTTGLVSIFFFKEVLKPVNKFARTQAEADFLVAEFLERLVTAIVMEFISPLRREEALESKKVFDAESAAEVPGEGI